MKHLFLCAIFALLTCFFVCGCGHNAITYGDGVMLETTINPENWTFGVSFRYGKILTACVRENSELEMEGAGSGKGENGGTAGGATGAESTGKVKFKIGRQITGYYVDAVKAGVKPEELQKYIQGGDDTQNPASAPKTPENAK